MIFSYFIYSINILVLIITKFLLNNKKFYLFHLSFLFLFLFLFLSLRNNVGQDYSSYYNIIYSIINDGYKDSIGFDFIVKFLSFFKFNIHFIIGILNFIISFLFIRFLYLNTDNKFFSILGYFCLPIFFLASLNTISFSLAASIILSSINFEKLNIKKLIASILIASLFHLSAIIFIPFLLFFINNRFIRFVLLGACLLLIISFIGLFAVYFTDYTRFLLYENYEYSFNRFLVVLFTYSCFLFLSFFSNLNVLENRLFKSTLFFSVIILILSRIVGFPDEIIVRALGYFSPFFLIILDRYLKNNRYKNFILVFCSLFFIIYYYFSLINGGINSKLIPYNSWLQI